MDLLLKPFFHQYFPNDLVTFISIMKNNDLKVTGSCALRLLLGKPFLTKTDCSDLDIFVPTKSYLVFDQFLQQIGYEKVSCRVSRNLSSVMYVNDNVVIDCVITDQALEVMSSFDLSVCMNWFDGDVVLSLYPEITMEYKMINFCPVGLGGLNSERIAKYKKRGFMVIEGSEKFLPLSFDVFELLSNEN